MIPVACPFAQYLSHQDEIKARIEAVIASGVYIGGPEVERFEGEFAEYTGTRFAIGVSSGLDALILSLQALGVGPGDEVITVAMTAPATVQAIKAVGATPIVVDVVASTRTMDLTAAGKAITPQTKAIIPVHLYGQPCEMIDFVDIPIIEDCAQATGARVGTFGTFGCFSFYPTKNLGAIGDGGMVITSDWWLAKKVRELRLSHRLDPLQAAILSAKLPHLDENIKRRRRVGKLYEECIKGYGKRHDGHAYHLYVIENTERDGLRDFLADKGVGTAIHYAEPAYPCNLPVTSRLCREVLSLPMYPELTDDQIAHVTASLRQWNAQSALQSALAKSTTS